jgi:hypothetical protein
MADCFILCIHLFKMSSQYSEYVPSSQTTTSSGGDEVIDLVSMRKEAEWIKLSLDPARCQQLLERLPTVIDGWCWIVLMKGNKAGGDGYVQLSHAGANNFALLHEVVLWSKGEFVRAGEQISHLCSNTKCRNPHHIISEPSIVNQSRKNCPVWVACAHKDCRLPYLICCHKPYCVKYCEGCRDEHELSEASHH